ncbi:MAG TPA: MFS transporter [Streptosporangiaceae bacterium]|nr:MFS transporter [Streptosporangiaceae bacterium]
MAGLMLGSWFTRLPELRIQLGLSYGELGAVLLAQAIGLIIAIQLAEPLFARFGHRLVVWLVAIVVPWFLPLMAAIHGLLAVTAGMLGWGLTAGVIDVGMNALGVRTERVARRPILNSLHATWGAGALIGSLVTIAAVHAGLGPFAHFFLLAITLTAFALIIGRQLLPDSADADDVVKQRARFSLRGGWTRAVVVLGILGAAAAICETSVSSWCGIFLTGQRDAAVGVASLGYPAFIVAETATRMIGDRLHLRFGAVALVRGCLAVTALGLLTVIAVPVAWVDIAGFALQGCGIAVLIPIITGAAGHGGAPDGSAAGTRVAIARYSTLYYAGAMTGPAIVGWLAQFFGVGTALALLLVPLVFVALLAKATAPASFVNNHTARKEPELVSR